MGTRARAYSAGPSILVDLRTPENGRTCPRPVPDEVPAHGSSVPHERLRGGGGLRRAGGAARGLQAGRVPALPVITADYDQWVHANDAAQLNDTLAELGLAPDRSPLEARRFGRYVLDYVRDN